MATAPLPGPADAWTATQVRWEMMSWLTNASLTYDAPQFVTDAKDEESWIHAVVSLDKEGYVRYTADPKVWPSTSAYAGITPKGVKLVEEWAAKGLIVDRST